MILRSVTKHVREQNWFAVGIDFLIVIVGVFIGIQVANWNDARLEVHEEVLLVDRIRSDFERIEEDADRSLAYHQARASDLKILVRSLRRESLADGDRLAVERALFLGPAFQTSADNSGTFTELLSSGRANLLRDRVLLNELVAYEDFLERFATARTFYVDMAFGVQQPFNARFEYDIESFFFTDDLQLNLDQPAISNYDFDAMVADSAFYDAAERLFFVHSLYSMWRLRISKRVERIQQMLAEASREALNNSARSAFRSEKPQIVWCDCNNKRSDSSRSYGRVAQRARCAFSDETQMGRAFAGQPPRFDSLIWNDQTTLAEATPAGPAKTPSRPRRDIQRFPE